MIKRYKTKPCEIEAIQWTGSNLKEVLEFANNKIIYNEITAKGSGELLGYEISIKTLEGIMLAGKGDFIIKGLRGEFYPCKPYVFKKKYEVIK